MTPYKIAEYLTHEAKHAAVTTVYDQAFPYNGRLYPVDAAGQCPMGVALRAMGLHCPDGRPEEYEIAKRLLSQDDPPSVDPDGLAGAAQTFVNDWDYGRINDLAAALGVER